NHEGRQPVRVDLHALDVDALPDQLLADEAAQVLVADPSDYRASQAQPGGANRDVGRAAADRLGEGRHVLQAASDLLPVQVDGGAPHGDHVEVGLHQSPSG